MNYTHKPSKNIHKSSIIPNEMGLFFSMNPMFFFGHSYRTSHVEELMLHIGDRDVLSSLGEKSPN